MLRARAGRKMRGMVCTTRKPPPGCSKACFRYGAASRRQRSAGTARIGEHHDTSAIGAGHRRGGLYRQPRGTRARGSWLAGHRARQPLHGFPLRCARECRVLRRRCCRYRAARAHLCRARDRGDHAFRRLYHRARIGREPAQVLRQQHRQKPRADRRGGRGRHPAFHLFQHRRHLRPPRSQPDRRRHREASRSTPTAGPS